MTWIETVPEDVAEGEIAALYDDYKRSGKFDRVAEILKAFSLSPDAFAAHIAFYRQLAYGKGPLRRYQREMIAACVSRVNECHY